MAECPNVYPGRSQVTAGSDLSKMVTWENASHTSNHAPAYQSTPNTAEHETESIPIVAESAPVIKTRTLTERWMKLYSYIVLPFCVLLSLNMALSAFSAFSPSVWGVYYTDVIALIAYSINAVLSIVAVIGLNKRTYWGWAFNQTYLTLNIIMYASAVFTAVQRYSIDTLVYQAIVLFPILIFFALNLVYFGKRKRKFMTEAQLWAASQSSHVGSRFVLHVIFMIGYLVCGAVLYIYSFALWRELLGWWGYLLAFFAAPDLILVGITIFNHGIGHPYIITLGCGAVLYILSAVTLPKNK